MTLSSTVKESIILKALNRGPGIKMLAKGQGLVTRLFSMETSSIAALKKMLVKQAVSMGLQGVTMVINQVVERAIKNDVDPTESPTKNR